jgi:hypothetical protein
MNLERFFLIGCVLLFWLAIAVLFYGFYKVFVSVKKSRITILDKVRDLIYEAPDGGIESVSVTLSYKSGATIVLRGPPEKEPSVDRLPAEQADSETRRICALLRQEAAYAKVLGI